MNRVDDERSPLIPKNRSLGESGEATSVPGQHEMTTSQQGVEEERALAETLNTMERICNPSNLREALERVVQGARIP